MSTLKNTATMPAQPGISSLEESYDRDVKITFEHVETSATLQNTELQAEADWVRSLTDEEFEVHNRRLVRKVSRVTGLC